MDLIIIIIIAIVLAVFEKIITMIAKHSVASLGHKKW